MSVPNKSIDKNKRYAGVKANDFVNKTRTNETSRATARTQGWANLGKINSRRVPPPANVPSLKSETGTNPPSFDPIIPTGTSHGWTATGNSTSVNSTRPLTPSKQPTQQQLDALPAHSLTPPSTQSATEIDKPRLPTTWSTVTSGNSSTNDQPPNLLALNDFPRLVTQDNKSPKSPSESLINSLSNTTNQGPSFRPANLASWKEGGGRAQPITNDSSKDTNDNSLSMQSSTLTTNTNSSSIQAQMSNSTNSSYMRMYPQPLSQQMWSYNSSNSYGSYGTNQAPASMSMHHQQTRVSSYSHSNQSQNQQQRLNTSSDYKTPTILRHKDIDDLSKLTDNVTWASASQEVNYEEKIRFSDDEDNDPQDHNIKSRRLNNAQQQSRQTYPHVLQNRSSQNTRSRLLQDDEHVRQMQDDKNSELISTLTVAKQRRDEQERYLRDQRTTTSTDQKQIPGYQTRPLLTSTGQDNLSTSQTDSSLWRQTNSGTTATTITTTTTTTSTSATTRTRHDTADSQTFTMKSWSDQMESFNYASLHEKSGGQGDLDDDPSVVSTNRTRKYSRSQSESSSHSQPDDDSLRNRSKRFPLSNRPQIKSNTNQVGSKQKTTDVIDYFENNETQMKSNDQWGDWEEKSYSNNNRFQSHYSVNDRRRPPPQQQQQQCHQQQKSSDDLVHKSTRSNEQNNDFNRTKQSIKPRPNLSRTSDMSSSTSTKSETKQSTNRSQPAWRPLSPTRTTESNDPTPQEAISYKTQTRTNDMTDRRQSAPIERKSRYNTMTTPIDTASIPPLMSVRSDVPPPSVSTSINASTSKHFKTSNQSQRQDYNTSSHYSQRNDFYNENNDAGWGNDDEYYDDETGYYDSSLQTHQRHSNTMGYHGHGHHRGYTTLGTYGRYRRGGTLRHQQQYNTYHTSNTTNTSSQLNTSTGSKTKKNLTNRMTTTTTKKSNESSESNKPVEEPVRAIADEPVKTSSVWNTESKSSATEEIPIFKSVETPALPLVIEKSKDISIGQKSENETTVVGHTETDFITPNKKSTTIANTSSSNNTQKKSNRDQQNYYQNSQTSRHRNVYARSTQDYDNMQMSTHHYYNNNTRRTATRGARNTRLQDLSSGYYYEHSTQRYNNRYSYSTDHYQKQNQTRSTNKTKKRGNSATTDYQQTRSITNTGTINLSDNEQKEGEEWETASESSANMRNNHHENDQLTTSEIKSTKQDRTSPKKSFTSQRPINTRHYDSNIHRRTHTLHERGSKSTRDIRTTHSTINQNPPSPSTNEDENSNNKQSKKDPHRYSLDGYDLNNVAGVVKIETLPASALEEESTAFDDGGEKFCVVMSKRGRKEQKAAQLSKQNAVEVSTEQITKSASTDTDEQANNEKSSTDPNQTNSTRARNGKSVPPRFNSKSSSTRQNKADHTYYYDQNYYYYDQNQYYDHDGSYYNYGNYNNQIHRQSSARRKTRNPSQQETNPITEGRKIESEKISSNVMSNIQMWNPQMDNPISTSSKLIEKPIHERKFANEIVPSSSSNDTSLSLPLTTHSPASKTTENLARTIKPPSMESKTERENKTKSTNFEKTDTISSLGSNQLFDKGTFLDYDDKQSIGTVGDDYNQKINSLKTIWDISDQPKYLSTTHLSHSSLVPSVQLEQTINSMVAMQQQQQHQDSNVQSNNPNKSDNYVQESIASSTTTGNTNVSSTGNDDSNNKNSSTTGNLQSTGSSSTMNQSTSYSNNPNSNKNEQKNICTVKPTQQVPPNIQDQVDINGYPSFPAPPLPPPMSQASLQQQQQQHLLPQSQVNPLHQQHSYAFYDSLLPPPPPQQQQPPQQQPQFNRMYSSTTNSTSTDPINSDFSSVQSSQLYAPQNFSYRNTNVYMPPPNVSNTNSMYLHTSQASISAPPQNNAMPPPPPMASYPSPFLVDHSGHMISQAQPPQAYMNNQMMSGRPQGAPYYRTPPQQQLPTPPGPPYGAQDPLAHGGYYPPFFQAPNSNAPPVGHPSPHNLYGQNEGFHPPPPPHPQMFPRGGSIDRGDHPLMSQPLSRPNNYPSNSSNQQQPPPAPPQGGPPPSLLSQNIKPYHANQPAPSSSNQAPFYPPHNQYNRQPMPIGAMNTTNNRQQTQQVPSLMSGLNKNFSNNGNNLNNTPSLFPHRQPLLPSQSNNNRSMYQHHNQYSTYSKSTGPNDDNAKPKHI